MTYYLKLASAEDAREAVIATSQEWHRTYFENGYRSMLLNGHSDAVRFVDVLTRAELAEVPDAIAIGGKALRAVHEWQEEQNEAYIKQMHVEGFGIVVRMADALATATVLDPADVLPLLRAVSRGWDEAREELDALPPGWLALVEDKRLEEDERKSSTDD